MTVVAGELREATIQAERTLLGCILIYSSDGSQDAIDYCRIRLLPSDFIDHKYSDPQNIHSRIYQAMLQCQAPNQLSVALKLNEATILRKGDIAYLSYCIETAPFGFLYDEYCNTVKQYSNQRQGIRKPKVIGIPYE